MGDDHKFTGVILVRRDSGIKKVTDLKGKKISYPAPTALAATMMPQYYFYTHGLNVMKDAENIYVGSQESSIMNVYLGFTSAAATWPLPWEAFQKEHPDKAKDLMVAWETEPLINNGVVVRNDISPELAEAVAKHMSELHLSEEGRIILSRMPLSGFERAKNKDYKIIENFLKEFSAKVRPVL
jgi:phosphonate transport system substrate-binding protein